MPSKKADKTVFVWVWLPDQTEPIVAGRIDKIGDLYSFTYGQSYLDRDNAMTLSAHELPLIRGPQAPLEGLAMAGCLRDGAPDAWGRRVILNKTLGSQAKGADPAILDELTYLMESGSDRIGALDFQLSAKHYEPRQHDNATLEELVESADRIEQGVPLSPELDLAIQHGSSIGGARPKALLSNGTKKFVAKFSLQSDTYNLVKGEFVAMRLANLCGLNVAPVELSKALNKDVLLIERFDRIFTAGAWQRRSIQSVLTLLRLDEMMARYASYEDFAEIIRREFADPLPTLKELYGRLVFNILSGNNDDHARNHAAFWDGEHYTLTPAYDICPQSRTGNETSQAMLISGNNRAANLLSCVEASHHFFIDAAEARVIIMTMLDTIKVHWEGVTEDAKMNETEKAFFWRRQFLNPSIFIGFDENT